MTTKFDDISGWLKFAAIISWIIAGFWTYLLILFIFAGSFY